MKSRSRASSSSSDWPRYGWYSTWSQMIGASSSASSAIARGKFDTPSWRTAPCSCSSRIAPSVSASGVPSVLGQWISSRSTYSRPSSDSEASSWRRTPRPLSADGSSFVVRKISSRDTPPAAIARPTSVSLPYIRAVSMWR